MVICKDCKHSRGTGVWGTYCVRSVRKIDGRNPVDGQLVYIDIEGDGNMNPFELCKYINKGDCLMFKQKAWHRLW